jgi:hypothetical protein
MTRAGPRAAPSLARDDVPAGLSHHAEASPSEEEHPSKEEHMAITENITG